MSRTVVISQPTYLPWLGYFELIAKSDVFVFLDNVQCVKQSWHNRNRLKGNEDQLIWLTVPVKTHPLDTPLFKIQISHNSSVWRRKHLGTIQACLGSTDYFHTIFPLIQELINYEYEYLVDLNISLIKLFADLLGLSPNFVKASDLNPQGRRTEMLVNLCQQLDADYYYSPMGSKVYLEEEKHLFIEEGIKLNYQTWEHPYYSQRGKSFVSHLSILDTLMNIGLEATRSLIITNKLKDI
ncbi:WbqC family protein [Nostoc punctiforme UO1]|uniref:WbqC family protein n=1 Tax=Nostoc punctiforme TaxID=272131 RepID=UPI0030964C2A